MLDYGSYSHGCPFANTQKMDLQSDQQKGRIEERRPIFKLIEDHFQIDRSLQGEIAKEQRPHRFREHLQPFGTAGREQLPAPHLWTQRQPGDAFVVSLCHWEGLGSTP